MTLVSGSRVGVATPRSRRRPTPTLPGPVGASSPLPRRRPHVTVRAGRRPSRIGLILGGIVVAFSLGLISLAQTVQVSATGYDIDRLVAERARLEDQRAELISELSRLGREPAVRRRAIDFGLTQLANPLIVEPR